MTTHTPGPWNTVGLSGDRIAIVAQDATDVATLTHASIDDARLIAAAPELLAALEMIREAASGHVPLVNSWVLSVARAAIAKATEE